MGNEALIEACKAHNLEEVSRLLQEGADLNTVNTGDNKKYTPLHWACDGKGNLEIVKALLDAGANPNALSRGNTTPFMWACRECGTDIINELLENGANPDPDVRNVRGSNPLNEACFWGNPEAVKLLLDRGVDVNTSVPYTGGDKVNVLITAIENERTEVVEILLRAGADIKLGEDSGYTPEDVYSNALHYSEKLEIQQLIIAKMIEEDHKDFLIEQGVQEEDIFDIAKGMAQFLNKDQCSDIDANRSKLNEFIPGLHEQSKDLELLANLFEEDSSSEGEASGCSDQHDFADEGEGPSNYEASCVGELGVSGL